MTTELWVFDLDGTLINTSNASMKERDIILSYLDSDDGLHLISEAEKCTLEHPLDFPLLYDGLPTSFVEDSYLWRNAQIEFLWQHMRQDKDRGDFSYEVLLNATKDEEIQLVKGAKKFIENLLEKGCQPIIVTNSTTSKGLRCVEKLGFDIPVYGSAKKYIIEKNHPFSINGRVTYSERPYYERRLNRIISDYRVKPSSVYVVGDVFTFDLSYPHRIGMNCIFVKNTLDDGFKTPENFSQYAKKSNVPVISSLVDLMV
jgi:FMN phosphatase YigB (HAD superfamily)